MHATSNVCDAYEKIGRAMRERRRLNTLTLKRCFFIVFGVLCE
jgi:hypothetical protein